MKMFDAFIIAVIKKCIECIEKYRCNAYTQCGLESLDLLGVHLLSENSLNRHSVVL